MTPLAKDDRAKPRSSDFAAEVRRTRSVMHEAVDRFAAGHSTLQGFSEDFHHAMVRGHTAAWTLGRKRAGDTSEASQADHVQGREMADREHEWFQGFLDDLQGERYKNSETGEYNTGAIKARADLYAKKLRGTANEAWAATTFDQNPDDEIDWVDTGDPAECDDCRRIADGSPYTASTLFTYPGAGDTECLGNCLCHLVRKSDGGSSFKGVSFGGSDSAKTMPIQNQRGPVFKRFGAPLLKAELTDNQLSVVASVTGVPDRIEDVIFPGAFASCTKGLTADGFVSVGHDWDDLPIGYIVEAKEVGNQLLCTAEFHSTAEAQDARTVAMERMAAGKSVSVSIGFMPDYDNEGTAWFESGEKLLEFAKNNGYDLSLFDTKSIKAITGMVRAIIKISEVFEFSIVCVGANQGAKATDVKGLSLKATGSLSELPLSEHFDAVLSMADPLVGRLIDYKATRDREDRPISKDRRAQLTRLQGQIAKLLEVSAEDEKTEESGTDSEARFKELSARTLALRTAQLAGA